MCDAPLGFVQTEAPNNVHSYDDTINEVDRQKNNINDSENASENDSNSSDDEVLIQIGTGFKKVEAGSENSDNAEDMPHIPSFRQKNYIREYCVPTICHYIENDWRKRE